MFLLFTIFFISFSVCFLLIKYQRFHLYFSGDSDQSSLQKIHTNIVPRIGGFAIYLALAVTTGGYYVFSATPVSELCVMVAIALPAFLVGLYEDLTKHGGIKFRLLGISISALLAGFYYDAWVTTLGLSPMDMALTFPIMAIIFTVFAVCGVANAYNIIDGFNGLASMTAILVLVSLSFISWQVNDSLSLLLSLLMLGAIGGFLLWNYPLGKIFLGDGGAYLIGFWIAFVCVLLVSRNPQVSPFYVLVINAYPVVETIFTMWRRKFHKNKNVSVADNMHLHTLIYRRVVVWDDHEKGRIASLSANYKTSPYLWLLGGVGVLLGSVFWNNTSALIGCFLLFSVLYVQIFVSIVRFKVPKWLQ